MEVTSLVKSFVEEKASGRAGKKELRQDTPLFSTGLIDSFTVLELLTFLEDTFEIEIDPARYQPKDYDTLQKISSLVLELRHRGAHM